MCNDPLFLYIRKRMGARLGDDALCLVCIIWEVV